MQQRMEGDCLEIKQVINTDKNSLKPVLSYKEALMKSLNEVTKDIHNIHPTRQNKPIKNPRQQDPCIHTKTYTHKGNLDITNINDVIYINRTLLLNSNSRKGKR